MPGLTLDTGALIAVERGDRRMRTALLATQLEGAIITVPAPVIVEWWRGDTARCRRILEALVVEPLNDVIAKLAGEACAAIAGATATDAVVMASAAQRGDIVYTSDLEDLERLRSHFKSVPRLLRA